MGGVRVGNTATQFFRMALLILEYSFNIVIGLSRHNKKLNMVLPDNLLLP